VAPKVERGPAALATGIQPIYLEEEGDVPLISTRKRTRWAEQTLRDVE